MTIVAVMNPLPRNRVWKGIFGIRNLTKIRCRIQENAKYLGGKRDSPKFRAREVMTTQIRVLAANAI